VPSYATLCVEIIGFLRFSRQGVTYIMGPIDPTGDSISLKKFRILKAPFSAICRYNIAMAIQFRKPLMVGTLLAGGCSAADYLCRSGRVDCDAINSKCATAGLADLQIVKPLGNAIWQTMYDGTDGPISYNVGPLAWNPATNGAFVSVVGGPTRRWNLLHIPLGEDTDPTLVMSNESIRHFPGDEAAYHSAGYLVLRQDIKVSVMDTNAKTRRTVIGGDAGLGVTYHGLHLHPITGDLTFLALSFFGANDHSIQLMRDTVRDADFGLRISRPFSLGDFHPRTGSAVWESAARLWMLGTHDTVSSHGAAIHEIGAYHLFTVEPDGDAIADAPLSVTDRSEVIQAMIGRFGASLGTTSMQLVAYDKDRHALLFKIHPGHVSNPEDLSTLHAGIVAVDLETLDVSEEITIPNFAAALGFSCDAHDIIQLAIDNPSQLKSTLIRMDLDRFTPMGAGQYLSIGGNRLYQIDMTSAVSF
jgi:hypothetical protein